MSPSLLKTGRFQTGLGIWLLIWTGLQVFVLTQYHLPFTTALYDSIISNLLLSGFIVLVVCTLQFYLPCGNRYNYLLGLCISITAIWLVVSKGVLLLFLNDGSDYRSLLIQSVVIRGAEGFMVISCSALISTLWYVAKEQQEADKRNTDADRLAKEAELNNLRQQLQPHFLFNSLNSINALVGSQPQKARTMIQQLSDFLRGTLRKDQKDWVSLDEELQHLQLYLDIEKVRFGHRLNTSIINETNAAQVPLMLLQPVVENAIKFGLYDTIEPITITIEVRQTAEELILTVSNPFDPETSPPQKGLGFGLKSVQRRLYLLFARQDLVQTTVNENIFTTIIKIPQT